MTNFDLSEYADVLAEFHSVLRQQQQQRAGAAGAGEGDGVDSDTAVTSAEFGGEEAAETMQPTASIRQRLMAAKGSPQGVMKPGPAAVQEPCEEAIKTIQAFFAPNKKLKARKVLSWDVQVSIARVQAAPFMSLILVLYLYCLTGATKTCGMTGQ